tara:strand:+ start:113629 stop:114354 length:726 start_codon:yes stop_codon:yes gene_type:complete
VKAMIFAAGLGTRLKPLTDERPKALVEVSGKPMLFWVIARLKQQGFTDIIINTYHYADQIIAFVNQYESFGVSLRVSVEEKLLDTGGGLKNAAWFLDREDFLVHNVDILTDLDYKRMMEFHRNSNALVTLAVKERTSSRQLLFDSEGSLCGWQSNETRPVHEDRNLTPLPFMGVSIMSPMIFGLMKEVEKFSIIDFFLDLVSAGEKICAFRADGVKWVDLGKISRIQKAEILFGREWFENL